MRPSTYTFSYGSWEVEVLDEDLVKLSLRRRDVKPPVEMLWYADHIIRVWDLARYLNMLDLVLERGKLSICVNNTFYELTRVNDDWELRARGAFEFELVGLNTRQAMCIALLLLYAKAEDPMEDDFAKAVRLMGLIPVLESIRELRISGMDMEAVVTWHDNRLVLRPIRATPLSELTTLLSLAEAGVLEEPEVEITAMSEREFEEFMAGLLLGKLDEEDLYENKAFVPIRRELAKLVVEHVPHEGEVEILEDKVVVRNALGEWEVELEDGGLNLNGSYICVEPATPSLNVIVLPGVGELRLGKVSMEVVAALMVALRPEDVKERRLREQIEKAASSE